MREYFKRYVSLGVIVLAFSSGWNGMASADKVHSTVTVFVNVQNPAQAPDSLVRKAEKEAGRIYQDIGVRLVTSSVRMRARPGTW